MNENETSLYPVVEPSAFPITNRNQPESTMLRMQEDPPATTEPKMSTDVDVLELDGEFDYEGYQVVRREFFAHTYEPSVTFNNYKFYVNAACLNRFPTVDFVQVLVNQERKILAIRPCEEGDRDAFAWATNSRGRRRARQVSCRLFFAKVFSLMGWNLDNRYKLLGRIIHANDEWLIAFDLSATEIYQRVSKDGEKPCTSRRPIFPESWKNQFGLPYKEHQQSIEVYSTLMINQILEIVGQLSYDNIYQLAGDVDSNNRIAYFSLRTITAVPRRRKNETERISTT